LLILSLVAAMSARVFSPCLTFWSSTRLSDTTPCSVHASTLQLQPRHNQHCTPIQMAKAKQEASLSNNSGRERPNSCTYWVSAQHNLLAGEYPTVSSYHYRSSEVEEESRQKLGRYLDCGIRTFVDLTHEGEKPGYLSLLRKEATKRGIDADQEIIYRRIAVPDFGIPTKETMVDVLNTIDDRLNERPENGVYVHCRGGIGRTGTTVGCWLVRNSKMSGSQALEETNRLFRMSDRSMESSWSPETAAQMDFVRRWQE